MALETLADLISWTSGPIVTVNILYGDGEKKPVFVHKSYICEYSKYFRDSLAEAETQEIDLEGTDPQTFNRFLSWTYHQSLPTSDPGQNQFNTNVKLWIFADRYIVPKLQNEMMNIIIGSLNGTLERSDPENIRASVTRQPNALLEYIYKNTTESSRLRRVLVDYLAVAYRGLNLENLPLEMIRDIFKSVQLLPEDSGAIRRDRDYYFVNGDID
jgi:hypothetical protein